MTEERGGRREAIARRDARASNLRRDDERRETAKLNGCDPCFSRGRR